MELLENQTIEKDDLVGNIHDFAFLCNLYRSIVSFSFLFSFVDFAYVNLL